MFLPAAPCHSGDEFPMQRYEAVVGWPRFSLPTGENLPLGLGLRAYFRQLATHLPMAMRRTATFGGIVKSIPERQGAKAPNQREKVKPSNR